MILGLIQLTRETEFESRHVFFSRYQLIRLLGWRNEGKSYSRLETSLKRWIGVTFYYEKAWWDKAKQSWVDENFHILERVSLFDRRHKAASAASREPALSMFCWNEVVFRSFQSGYLKRIDMALYRRLESPIAKRLYRLLDKRFYHKPTWEFDLRELACEHVGLSRNYDTGGLKRKLRPAIAELEAVGYLKSMDPDSRFVRVARGSWQVLFRRGASKKRRGAENNARLDAETSLVSHGVNPATAAQLVVEHGVAAVRQHVDVLNWLLTESSRSSPRSPAGFLVESIRHGYEVPARFRDSSNHITTDGEALPKVDGKSTRQPEHSSARKAQQAKIARYLKSLTDKQRKRLEQQAFASADPLLASAYTRAVDEGSDMLLDVYRRLIIERHILSRSRNGGRKRLK